MHLAARCGSAEAMDWLYQHGGKPRAKTEVGGATHLLLPLCPLCRSRRSVFVALQMGRSVMHDAAEHGSVRVLEWLRVHGARADISSREVRCMLPH